MPYIDEKDRDRLEPKQDTEAMTPGELNFAITVLVDQYLAHGLDYQAINDVVGVLECVKLETARRIVGPYEDFKREVNGDVYVTASDRRLIV